MECMHVQSLRVASYVNYKFGLGPIDRLFYKCDLVLMHKLYKLKAGKSAGLICASIFTYHGSSYCKGTWGKPVKNTCR